jgi:hypothetical protein
MYVLCSCVAPGRGLFVRVAAEEGVDQVTLDAGTLISGYSKTGSWATNWAGDKGLAMSFSELYTPLLPFPSCLNRHVAIAPQAAP